MFAALILILYLVGTLSAQNTAAFLLLTGIAYLGLEIFVTSFGLLALNGFLALYISYALYNGLPLVLGVPIGWGLVFGIAFVELLALAMFLVVLGKYARKKAITGREGLIGQEAAVQHWLGSRGKVFIMGENWQAISESPLDLAPGQHVIVQSIHNLTLTIKPKD